MWHEYSVLFTFLGVICTGLFGLWAAVMKARIDRGAQSMSRIDMLEKRICEVESRLDEERAKRREAEVAAHRVRLVFSTVLDWVANTSAWIDAGCKPPPPEKLDLAHLREVIRGVEHDS